jgi:hypothetical protein
MHRNDKLTRPGMKTEMKKALPHEKIRDACNVTEVTGDVTAEWKSQVT